MSKQTINIGASPNDGTGTPLRTSFDYTNQNFTELYTAVGPSGNNIVVPGNATITGDLTVDTSTLKVDSTNNRVGIVNATPSFTLDVNGAGSVVCARISSGSGTGFRFDTTRNVGGLNRNYLIGPDILNEGWFSIIPSTALGGGTFTNSIYNASSDGIHAWNNGAGAELMRLNTTGNLVLKGGTAAANGVGVTFPSTQVASSDANCLDDYEEGAWTPTSTSGTNLTSISHIFASYTKIGRVVTLSGYFSATVTTGSTLTSFTFAGLPFAVTYTQAGALYEDTTLKVGFSQTSTTNLSGFFAAGTALASGSKQFTYSITYYV